MVKNLAEEKAWTRLLLDKVKVELEPICSNYGVRDVCEAVLESIAEMFLTWFEGKKKKTIVATVLYISLLIAKGVKRGILKTVLDRTDASKPAVNDAISNFVKVNWELGIVYMNPKLYTVLRNRLEIPSHVIPYTMSEIIKVKLRMAYPGLFEFLEILCQKNTGRDCISLLLEDPAKLRDLILTRYNIPLIAKRIAEKLIAPIVEELDINIPVSILADLFVNNPNELRKILSSNLQRTSQ
jgi:hypothetical protein